MANRSDFGGDPVQDRNPWFPNPDPNHAHSTSAVSSPLRSPGGSTILGGGGLSCSSIDFLATITTTVAEGLAV